MSTENLKLFSERLKLAQKRAGKTIASLSNDLGAGSGTIGNWRTAQNFPDTGMLLPLSRALGVTSDWLLGAEDEPGTSEHQHAPGGTIDPAVMDRLQELAEAAGFSSPSAFLAALLESRGVAYVLEINERRAERGRRSGKRRRAGAHRAEAMKSSVDDAERLAEEQGHQHFEAAQESEEKHP